MKVELVVTTFGTFRVVVKDDFGNGNIVADDVDLAVCLQRASVSLGFPLSLPLSRSDQ